MYDEYSANMDSTKMNLNFNQFQQTKHFIPPIKSRTLFENILYYCNLKFLPLIKALTGKNLQFITHCSNFDFLLFLVKFLSWDDEDNCLMLLMKTRTTTILLVLNFKSHWIDSKEWFEKQLCCSVYRIRRHKDIFVYIYSLFFRKSSWKLFEQITNLIYSKM